MTVSQRMRSDTWWSFARLWLDHQVPVVRNHTVAENPQGFSREGFPEHLLERRVIAIVVEQWQACVGAAQHVVGVTAFNCSNSSRHAPKVIFRQRQVKK